MAQPQASETKTSKSESESLDNESVIVVDVRKKYRRKHVRRLRKGRGKLMDKVEELVDNLREENALGDNVRPVVIVVREKKKNRNIFGGGGRNNLFGL